MNPDPVRRGVIARYGAFIFLVLLVAIPIYVYVEPPWRPLVARLAAAFVLGVALLELRAALARRIALDGGSALDEARRREAPEPAVPEPFLALMEDLRAATRNRRYFEDVFWPRVLALYTALGHRSDSLPRPPARSLHRGPSLATLRDVIAILGRRP